jgi:Zn-dependent protease with chaperone function
MNKSPDTPTAVPAQRTRRIGGIAALTIAAGLLVSITATPRSLVAQNAMTPGNAGEPLGSTSGGGGGLFPGILDRIKDALSLDPDQLLPALEGLKDRTLREVTEKAYRADPIHIDDEWRYGEEIGESVRSQLNLSTDRATIERIDRLAAPILLRLQRTKARPYTINVVEEDVMNAFAMLGGHIYIYRGLIDTMKTDAAIQAVIAHEIAHVELEHCVMGSWAGLRTAQVSGNGMLVDLVSGAFNQIQVGYSEIQEYECDEFAYRTQAKLGVPKEDRLRFVRVLKAYSDQHAGEETSDKPRSPADTVAGVLSRHYQTHPTGQERIDRLEALDIP